MNNSEFIKGMQNATTELIALQKKRMDKATLFLESKATENAPVDIGYLRSSMISRSELKQNEIYGMVGNTSIYAPYVHQGTGIYAVGKNGRSTPWRYYVPTGTYKGWHITKGQKPQPFLKDAREKHMTSIKKLLGVK